MLRRISLLFLSLFLLTMVTTTSSFSQTVKAPEFPPDSQWFNVSRPLKLSELRGRVVLLDFWTFCCINCMHVIPTLQSLEKQFGDKLTIIGVHSAKFDSEKDSENIRQAILRYSIEHPVINDADFITWNNYTVRAWPTLILIDKDGYIRDQLSGERSLDELHLKINTLLGTPSKQELAPLPISLEKEKAPQSILSFPGKVLFNQSDKRLFISDSSHNRIVVTDVQGKIQFTIGSGLEGALDGDFNTAQFKKPQGLALNKDILFVADTENHKLRAVNLSNKTVTTIAGTGQQVTDTQGGHVPLLQPLNSPWDLLTFGDDLFVAMAGNHQIWRYSITDKTIAPFAGSGQEQIIDGIGKSAAFAQPSGLSTDGSFLYVADSEVSGVRKIDIKTQTVSTIIGKGLFDFGDIDGDTKVARLQHPLGVQFANGVLYVADTYNNKVKKIDLKSNSIQAVAAGLSEPGGLAFGDGKIFIADTNKNQIQVLDPTTNSLSILPVAESKAPSLKITSPLKQFRPNISKSELPQTTLISGKDISFKLTITVPDGYHLNPLAPSDIVIRDGTNIIASELLKNLTSTLLFTLPEIPDQRVFTIESTLYYCKEIGASVCLIKSYTFDLPVQVSKSRGDSNYELKIDLPVVKESPTQQ